MLVVEGLEGQVELTDVVEILQQKPEFVPRY